MLMALVFFFGGNIHNRITRGNIICNGINGGIPSPGLMTAKSATAMGIGQHRSTTQGEISCNWINDSRNGGNGIDNGRFCHTLDDERVVSEIACDLHCATIDLKLCLYSRHQFISPLWASHFWAY